MRSVSSVKQKLRQARFKHQKKYLEAHLKKKPCNCKWNSSQKYVHQGTGELRIIGMCMYSVENPKWEIDICETEATARSCPNFTSIKDKVQLKEEFDQLSEDPEFLGTHLKDVAALKWVLNGDDSPVPTLWGRFRNWILNLSAEGSKDPPLE